METLQEGTRGGKGLRVDADRGHAGKKESVCQKEQPQPDGTLLSKVRYENPVVGR